MPGVGGSIRRASRTQTARRPRSTFSADPRPLVAVDWSLHGIHVTQTGRSVTFYPSFDELLETLTQPARVVCEATVESWDPERRDALLTKFRTSGHEIYVFRPIHTARFRKRHDIEKSDENDTRVIYRIATQGRLHLYPAPALDRSWSAERERVNARYVQLRLAGRKPGLVELATGILGPYTALPDELRHALGSGKGYSPSLLAAVTFATAHANSRSTWERLLGLHGSGYPTVLRSDVHHHSFQHARRRGVTWQEFRHALRWCYRQLREHRAELQAYLR